MATAALSGDHEGSEKHTQPKMVKGRYANPWDTWKTMKVSDLFKFMTGKNNSAIPSKGVSASSKFSFNKLCDLDLIPCRQI